MNYKYIPSSIFIDPPMTRCGYTEEEAIEKFSVIKAQMGMIGVALGISFESFFTVNCFEC